MISLDLYLVILSCGFAGAATYLIKVQENTKKLNLEIKMSPINACITVDTEAGFEMCCGVSGYVPDYLLQVGFDSEGEQ
jgi:hypothetical protein